MKEIAVAGAGAVFALVYAASKLTRNAAAVSWIALAVSLLALIIAFYALLRAPQPRTTKVQERITQELGEPTPDNEA